MFLRISKIIFKSKRRKLRVILLMISIMVFLGKMALVPLKRFFNTLNALLASWFDDWRPFQSTFWAKLFSDQRFMILPLGYAVWLFRRSPFHDIGVRNRSNNKPFRLRGRLRGTCHVGEFRSFPCSESCQWSKNPIWNSSFSDSVEESLRAIFSGNWKNPDSVTKYGH